jgi:hypothetical protein
MKTESTVGWREAEAGIKSENSSVKNIDIPT